LPVLLIHGKEDATAPIAVAEATLALIEAAGGEDVELISLSGVGQTSKELMPTVLSLIPNVPPL